MRVLPVTTRKTAPFASFRIKSNPLESKPIQQNIGIIPPYPLRDAIELLLSELFVFCLRAALVKI